jgi:predicted Zn finger-like uncharacterized protein
MTCSCPKCSAQIEFDPTDIPAEGYSNKCSECGTNYAISKESFAKRALHKSDEISCAECGDHPGSSVYCQGCHAIYPDFLVIETSSATKRQLGKLLAAFNILKHLKIGGAVKSHETYAAAPTSPRKTKGIQLPGQPAQLFVVLVVILSLFAAGGYYWYQDKLATTYTESYVRALHGVKMARDFDIMISTRLVADMKKGASSALTPEEKKSAALGKTDADNLMKRIGKVPAEFTVSNDSLKKLYDIYANLHSTVTSPVGSSDIYSGAVKQIDDDFRKNARELKAGLPEKISAQLAISSKKYKALQDL